MNEPTKSRDVSALIALVNAMIEYWKGIARRNFAKAHPQADPCELDVEFLGLPGERIPLEDGAVDTVVSSFTLCTIPGVEEAIRGIGRVLKPGGKLTVVSHGARRSVF
jgi:ubiquinone/menaquinone biosynthesis C-methylase UbiE